MEKEEEYVVEEEEDALGGGRQNGERCSEEIINDKKVNKNYNKLVNSKHCDVSRHCLVSIRPFLYLSSSEPRFKCGLKHISSSSLFLRSMARSFHFD